MLYGIFLLFLFIGLFPHLSFAWSEEPDIAFDSASHEGKTHLKEINRDFCFFMCDESGTSFEEKKADWKMVTKVVDEGPKTPKQTPCSVLPFSIY